MAKRFKNRRWDRKSYCRVKKKKLLYKVAHCLSPSYKFSYFFNIYILLNYFDLTLSWKFALWKRSCKNNNNYNNNNECMNNYKITIRKRIHYSMTSNMQKITYFSPTYHFHGIISWEKTQEEFPDSRRHWVIPFCVEQVPSLALR